MTRGEERGRGEEKGVLQQMCVINRRGDTARATAGKGLHRATANSSAADTREGEVSGTGASRGEIAHQRYIVASSRRSHSEARSTRDV